MPKVKKVVKRGRPKGSTNKKPKKVVKKKVVKAAKKIAKKKVGRPAGSKNVKPVKRGRPKGSIKNAEPEVIEEVYIPPKSYKHLGYCSCGFMISALDLISKFIYVCPRCEKRKRTNKLKVAKKVDKDLPTTKKEYLKSSVNADFHDMPPMEDADISNIKAIED